MIFFLTVSISCSVCGLIWKGGILAIFCPDVIAAIGCQWIPSAIYKLTSGVRVHHSHQILATGFKRVWNWFWQPINIQNLRKRACCVTLYTVRTEHLQLFFSSVLQTFLITDQLFSLCLFSVFSASKKKYIARFFLSRFLGALLATFARWWRKKKVADVLFLARSFLSVLVTSGFMLTWQ